SKSNNPSPQSISVTAYISGKERTRVRYQDTEYYYADGERKSRTVTRYSYAERDILRMDVNLGDVNGPLSEGARYRFPFSLQLPVDLPSSMSCEGQGGHCGVGYKIKAELRGNGGMFGRHKVEQAFTVRSAPLPMQPVPNLVPPLTEEVKFCCCFSVGKIVMGARVVNTRIGQGETAIIDFACKNQSLRQIERAEVTVKEEVRWSAQGRYNYSSRVIANQTFRPTERWDKMDKGAMKEQKERSRNITETLREEERKLLQTIHDAIHDGRHRALLNISPSSLQTYQGLLIQVTHRLKIKVYTGGSCTDNPTIKLQLYLGTPSSLLSSVEQQPGHPSSVSPDGMTIPTATGVPMPSPSAPPLSSPVPAMVTPSAPPAEWVGAVTATPVMVGQSAAVVGGNAIWEAEEEGGGTVPIAVAEIVPTLPNLLKEIEFAVSPLASVQKRLEEDAWKLAVFYPMTPKQYASVVKAVAIEFDQPDMAALVAPVVNACNFTHPYVIAALRVVADWIRTPLLSKVLPLCKDLDVNASKIKEELSDWELVCTQGDFEQCGNNDWGPDSPLLGEG
ncbi:hypothetical protein ACHAWF_007050, partial [Thalassiosira exigua]